MKKDLSKKLTELESLVETISRSKAVWESTFDVISDPVLIINKKFEIRRANKALAAACGQDIRDVIGKPCHKVFAGYDEPCPSCPVKETRESHQSKKVDLEAFPRSQRQYTVSAYCFPSAMTETEEEIVLHYRDVTEEKQLQRRLIHNEKMAAIGTLAGGVAHEVNNPLGGILAFAQLAMRQLPEDHSCYSDLKEIESATLRCKKIVRDLLDFSRYQPEEQFGFVDLNQVLEKSLPLLQIQAKQVGAVITENYQSDLPLIHGDFSRLQQVVINLATNACQAMKNSPGKLVLSTRTDKSRKHVFLDVEDTGVGIPQNILERIFDPYFTTKDQGEGTGLGLSISYKIIQEHEGRIDVQSKIGKGSRFTIELPIKKINPSTKLEKTEGLTLREHREPKGQLPG